MKKKLNSLIALAITVFFTIIVINKVDIAEMAAAFKVFDLRYLIILFPFFFVIMVLRVKRWKILLPENKCNFYSMYEIYMTSNLLNIFLPARAGDIFRGYYFGQKYDIPKLNAIGTVAAERILDGLTVVGMLILGMILYNHSPFVVNLAILSAVLFLFSFLLMLWIYKYNKVDFICNYVKNNLTFLPDKINSKIGFFIDKLRPLLNSFIKGFDTFANPVILFKTIFLSIISWSGDCIFIYLLVLAFGIKVDFTVSFFILSFIALSTIIPSSSIYVGLYQYAFILALQLYKVPESSALSMALAQQGIMLLVYIVIAVIFMFRNHLNFQDLKKDDINEKNT